MASPRRASSGSTFTRIDAQPGKFPRIRLRSSCGSTVYGRPRGPHAPAAVLSGSTGGKAGSSFAASVAPFCPAASGGRPRAAAPCRAAHSSASADGPHSSGSAAAPIRSAASHAPAATGGRASTRSARGGSADSRGVVCSPDGLYSRPAASAPSAGDGAAGSATAGCSSEFRRDAFSVDPRTLLGALRRSSGPRSTSGSLRAAFCAALSGPSVPRSRHDRSDPFHPGGGRAFAGDNHKPHFIHALRKGRRSPDAKRLERWASRGDDAGHR